MKTLKDYRVAGALYVNDTGVEAQVSDQVTLFLDTDAEPGFPASIVATIQHPITRVECGSVTSYVLEYNEADLLGAAALLRPQDVIDITTVSGVLVVANELDDEIARALAAEAVLQANIDAEEAARIADVDAEEARALAAEALLAPKASPTFTGTVTLPATTSIGTVSSVEIGYLDGVTSAIQGQIDLKAPIASPTFTGVPAAPTAAPATNTTQLATTEFVTTADNLKAPLASPTFTGIPAVPTAAYGTNTTQIASTAFVNAVIATGLAATPQSLSGPGAVNVTTLSTELTSTGGAEAITLADGVPGQIKAIVHGVDGGSMVLTPATKTGFTTITFTNAGESALLQFFATRGWMILSLNGAVAA